MTEAKQDNTAPQDAPDATPADALDGAAVRDAALVAPKPRKHRHVIRFFVWLGSFSVVCTLVLGLLVLGMTDREIVMPAQVTQRVEAKINTDLGGTKVSIGQMVMRVDDNFVPRVTARHVGILDPTGAELGRVDRLGLSLSKSALMSGQFTPEKLALSGAQITVRRAGDGAFAFDFGGDFGGAGALGGGHQEVLDAIEAAFAAQPLSDIESVEMSDITVTLEDARSGRVWQATDALITLRNTDAFLESTLDFALFNGTEDLAEARFELRRDKGVGTSTLALNITQAQTADVALQSPVLSFLRLTDAPVSAAMRAEIAGDGVLESFSGTLEIGAGTFKGGAGARPLAFDGAKGYFDYNPDAERLELALLDIVTDAVAFEGRGHVLLRDFDGNWPQKFVGQLTVDQLRVSPQDLLDTPMAFDQGTIDLSFELDPFRLQVGQLALRQAVMDDPQAPPTWLRGSGSARAAEDGWHAALDAHVDQVSAQRFMALWPPRAIPKTRKWMVENIHKATYDDVDLALRFVPNQPQPTFALDWGFSEAEIRVLKTHPAVVGVAGYGSIFDNRMSISIGAAQMPGDDGAALDLTDTTLTIPDITQKPATLEVDLRTQGRLETALSILSRAPFNALQDASFGADVAQGDLRTAGTLSFVMKDKVLGEDVTFAMSGALTDLSTRTLIEGQHLSASRLAVQVDNAGLTISGPGRLDDARFDGAWDKRFGRENKGKSRLFGTATLDQGFLDTFRIALPRGMMSGEGTGAFDVALVAGQPPAFTMTSDLRGATLAVPQLSWRKPAGDTGALKVVGTAGDVPRVDLLELSADGLTLEGGSVTLTAQGALERMRFERAARGNWLDVGVDFIGRGTGVPMAIDVTGGRLDLRTAAFGSGGSGGDQGAGGPITARLERLQATDSQRLTNVSAELTQAGGLKGSFTGMLNGQAQVTGFLDPAKYGTKITLTARDAGRVVQAAGLLDESREGELIMTLDPLPQEDSYAGRAEISGIRVQSAPELAELLSLASVVGLLDQMAGGQGILFAQTESEFTVRPGQITVHSGSAEGPSLGITLDGIYDTEAKTLDMEGVISPVYFLNALGQVVARKGEGLFGFNYALTGTADDPDVSVNPLSIFTPGALRDIFRKRPRGSAEGAAQNGPQIDPATIEDATQNGN